jgi:CHAT domain-containing protein
LDAKELFERLVKAINRHDVKEVQRLVQAATPLLSRNPSLQHWHTYARGYLALQTRQQPREALKALEALRAQHERLDPSLLGRVLNALGVAYEMNEQWDQAMRCYQESLAFQQTQGDELRQGITLYNMAIVHNKGWACTKAIDCARQAITLLNQNPDDRLWQINLGGAWNVLGTAQQKLEGHILEAKASFETCLAIWTKWGDPGGQGIAYHNLAEIYQRLGQVSQAEIYYQQAFKVLMEVGNRRQAADALNGLGRSKLRTSSPLDEAQALFEQALSLARATRNHEITTDIFLNRAELQERLGDTAAALKENRQAVQTVEALRANIALTEARIRLQGSRIKAYERMVYRLCYSRADFAQAFRYAEMCKSRAMIEMLAGRPSHPPQLRPPEHLPPEWLEQERELRRALHQLYQDPDAPQKQITTLESELAHVRERIRLHDAEFESFQTVMPLTLEQVQSALPADSVLLEYFTVEDNILAFVVTPRQANVVALPLSLNALQRAFKRIDDQRFGSLHNIIRDAHHHLRSPWILGRLYEKLVEPLGDKVQSARVLCVVPHGMLHYVPFHALYRQTPAGPRYWIEDGAEPRRVIYAPSATALLDHCQKKPTSIGAGCLALGHNDRALSQAEAEAQAVARIVGGASLCGTAATRAALLTQGANYRYIHLSCHGWFNPAWPMASSLALADGTLDVSDILQELRLNVEMVCLSACETGRSHILQGDELVGLTRAFLYAGTPSVVVSHWVVDELSTRLLMERFYQELKTASHQGATGAKALALARAQIAIKNITFDEMRPIVSEIIGAKAARQQMQSLADTLNLGPLESLRGDECLLAHPYYWAPFFLIGDRIN